jgi:hypothetical protein
LFESQTGVPVMSLAANTVAAIPNAFAYAEITPDNENLLIVEKYGKIRLQKIHSDSKEENNTARI